MAPRRSKRATFDVRTTRTQTVAPTTMRPFPWWGWAGLAIMAVSWLLSWTNFHGLVMLRNLLFTPLWVGYILAVSGMTFKRTDHCVLVDRWKSMLALFALSAVFWWFFEYLNRFTGNWSYTVSLLQTPLDFVLYGTLPFSTVLPAVLVTQEGLATLPRFSASFENYWRIRVHKPRRVALLVLFCCAAGLFALGLLPNLFFPLLWLAPLFILVSLSVLSGEEHMLKALGRGDWRLVCTFAAAALICGFFWEMWNAWSAAKWSYSIPYVGGVRVFEMPLLGYVGYIPFGLECAAVIALVYPDLLRPIHTGKERTMLTSSINVWVG